MTPVLFGLLSNAHAGLRQPVGDDAVGLLGIGEGFRSGSSGGETRAAPSK